MFYTSSASAELRNGLYVLDLTTSILPNQRGPRQIMTPTSMFDLETAIMIWSPDSSQILISQENRNILLDPTRLNTPESMSDVSHRLLFLFDEWEAEMYSKERVRLATFPPEIQRIASESARNVYVSPDGKKVVFTSIKTDEIPEELIQPTPSSSTQPEERQLVEGGVYVYDSIEDKVFRVGSNVSILDSTNRLTLADDLYLSRAKSLEASPSAFRRLQGETMNETSTNYLLHHTNAVAGGLQWLPDSQYLIGLRDGRVIAVEYDGTNETILYSGPLTDRFVYPWPNGSRLVILTNFNTDGDIPNLYSMSLR